MNELIKQYYALNIRNFLARMDNAGEERLSHFLSMFSCPKNVDVERFLKEQAVEFTKKSQSVTYLVFSKEGGPLLGYFTITIRPLTISAAGRSQSQLRKLKRVSAFDEGTQTYTTSAYLLAQLGKNFQAPMISGDELLGVALEVVGDLQYREGGLVAFVETEEEEKLLSFYQKNGFIPLETRPRTSGGELRQLFRLL